MTAAFSWALQQGLHAALSADPTIAGIVGERITDGFVDAGAAPSKEPSILIGEEQIRPWGSASERGADHRILVALIAADGGFGVLKQLAAAVTDVVLAAPTLPEGRIVLSRFLAARARRQRRGGIREIEMQFRVVIEVADPISEE
jgi:hypothetical protein